MTLEVGLSPLDDDLNWNLGGLALGEGMYGVVGDDGLEGFEVESEDQDAGGDGSSLGRITLPPRLITLTLNVVPDDATKSEREEAMDAALANLDAVVNPLPNRDGGQRMLRFRRNGGVAKRVLYRPANGQAVSVAGDRARIQYEHADIIIRLQADDPVIYSDDYTDYALVAGVAQNVTNSGSFVALMPPAWQLTGTTTTRLQNLTHGGDITFPCTDGGLTVTRRPAGIRIATTGTTGKCYGPGNTPFPTLPLLYPGVNSIKASANCTLRVWSTWLT